MTANTYICRSKTFLHFNSGPQSDMSRYSLIEKQFGNLETVELKDDIGGTKLEIALRGAVLLNYFIPIENNFLNIIDGFLTSEELMHSPSARSWVMAPFANRIPEGKYFFNGIKHQFKTHPGKEIMHGFAAYENFKIEKVNRSEEYIEAVLAADEIDPGKYEGYQFKIKIMTVIRLSGKNLLLKIICENLDDKAAPFGCGWHPYFKAGENSIDNLVLTIDAEEIIQVDDSLIPYEGKKAYADIKKFPDLDFRSKVDEKKRIIGKRELNHGYSNLMNHKDGFHRSAVYNPENGLTISMFQGSGITLVYSGDTLPDRRRDSIAVEPMQFITNAFNRKELMNKIKVEPGEKSEFISGVEYKLE